MDKKLIRAIKEQEKEQFNQKLKELSSSSKGLWLIRFIGIAINLFVSLLFSWIFKTDIDTSNLFDDITDEQNSGKKSTKKRDLLICVLLIITLFIFFYFSINKI